MKNEMGHVRLIRLAWALVLMPLAAGAQAPPVPPALPAVPALPATPVPPVPRAPERVVPFAFIKRSPDELSMNMDLDLKLRMEQLKLDEMRLGKDQKMLLDEHAQTALAEAKGRIDELRARGMFGDGAFELQGPTIVNPRIVIAGGADAYTRGLSQIQQRQYERAVASFDQAVTQKSARSDGALYWKAFAQARLVKTEEAIATLAVLRRDFPQSRYVNDARVLEADVRKMSGQQIDPQTLAANDEIKLLAINGIAHSDPNQAIPLLESVLNATNTLATKKRAIYVLALTEDPRARDLLLRYARGGGNPELQLEAIRYLATSGEKNPTELSSLYGNQDREVRRAVIQALAAQDNAEALVAIARKESDMELKREVVQRLSDMANNKKNKAASDYLMEVLK